MRKFAIAAALAGTTLTLAACSDGAEEAATNDETMTADAGMDTGTDPAAQTVNVLDANSASVEELTAVEGMTPELAQALVDGRPYSSATAFNAKLMETLGEEEAANVRTHVFVPVNLNTASREDIELIPGMTDKMVHEFEEYRPYDDMAEFDREIGKYVDEAEVARFRNYVTL